MDDRYFIILGELESKGVDIETDISDTVYKLFPSREKVGQPSDFSLDEIIRRFLNIMAENKHLFYSIKNGNNNKLIIEVRLTSAGLDYLYAHLLRKATLQSFERQGWNNRMTWGIAIAAIIISTGVSVWLGISNNSLDKRVYQLEQKQPKATNKPKEMFYRPKHIDTLHKNGGK